MKRSIRCLGGLTAIAMLGVMLLSSTNTAEARPQYLKAFAAKYPKLAAQAKKAKCNVCHFGKKKTNRNDYGKAVSKGFKKKNCKVPKIIDAALTGAEKEKNAKGVTFGSLIKEGKLPGTAPAE